MELKYPDGHPYAGHTLDLAFVITGEAAPPPDKYPDGHPYAGHTLDLAFVITGEAAPPPDTDWGDADDPTYPTLAPIGASHVIDARVYMGNTVDADLNGQPTPAADGDDNDAEGDDEDTASCLTRR